MSVAVPRFRGLVRLVALLLVAGTGAVGLAGCAGGPADDELVWYVNPDAGGQAAIAARCSTGDYTISTQVLPQAADQQRIQLARRLAAGDQAIDLMSLDPPFTAEFAEAGYLAPIPDRLKERLRDQSLSGSVTAATWKGDLVVAPFWTNTQVLWYRRSFTERAGLDMTAPVTWDQVIEAAADEGGVVGVQANKYEGYAIWINALMAGAGGGLLTDAAEGADATITIDTPAGHEAARVIEKLAESPAAQRDISISQEGQVLGPFAGSDGAFQVNWTFVFNNYQNPRVKEDIGWARYPRTLPDRPSRPPLGGIGVGVNAASGKVDLAMRALECITSPRNQGIYASTDGNMPASAEGYAQPELRDAYPADLLSLFQESVEAAAPRPATPYWGEISAAVQSSWHPPGSVDQQTPERSQSFVTDVLEGRRLL